VALPDGARRRRAAAVRGPSCAAASPAPPPPPAARAPGARAALAVRAAEGPADGARAGARRECGLPAAADGAAPEAFTELFAASRTGWTGGDATISERLPDGRTAWLFGDTFVAGVDDRDRREPAPFRRNSLVVQSGGCLETIAPILPEPDADRWYWPNDAVVRDDELLVFFTRLRDDPDDLIDGSLVARFDLATLELLGTVELPSRARTWWGAATVAEGGFEYVYGIDDGTRSAYVARTPAGELARGDLAFFDGTGWSDDPDDAKPLVEDAISNQMSVVPDGDDLLLVSQPHFSDDVRAWRASAPTGPFADPRTVATVPPVQGARTYHAMVHPHAAAKDGLLLSYNVIPHVADDVWNHASLYRPRFLRAPLPQPAQP
jgi:hypothetical protein